MVGVRGDEPLKGLRRLQLIGVGLVAGGEVRRGQERRKDRRLLVIWVAAGNFRHGVIVGLQSRAMIHLLVVAYERCDRLDIVLLALALEPRGAGSIQSGNHVLELRREVGRPGERVIENDHRPAPMGHAAGRVGLRDRLEGSRRRRPPEGVIERHAAIEFHLRRGVAVDLELYFAEALNGRAMVMCRMRAGLLTEGTGRKSDARTKEEPRDGAVTFCSRGA